MPRFWSMLRSARELRNREIQIFLFALTLGTAAITAPALLGERLSSGVVTYAADVLGGDASLSSPTPVPEELLAPAEELGLEFSRRISTPSIVTDVLGEKYQLTRLRAVDSNFPLRGQLVASATPVDGEESAQGQDSAPPQRGEIWLENFLAKSLEVELGEEVNLGASRFRFTKILIEEPGRASFFAFAPRAMINMQDLPATGIIGGSSRVTYRYIWAGEPESLTAFLAGLEGELQVNQRIIRADDEDTNFLDILRRLRAFLLLSGSLCIFLSSFALLLAIRHFTERNRRYVALLKTLGYTPVKTLGYLTRRIMPAAVVAYFLGCFGGWLGYKLTAFYLADLLPPASSAINLLPFVISGVSTLICLLTFALPSLWRLAALPPLYLLRPSAAKLELDQVVTSIIACAGIFCLLLYYSRDLILSSAIFGAVVGLIVVLSVLGYGLMNLIHKAVSKSRANVGIKIALTSLFRSWPINSFQILAFAAAFMLIGILSIMRVSFINDWQKTVEPGTPNYFLVNIQPDQVDGLKQRMAQNEIEEGVFAGIVRGKLVKVDGEGLRERTQRLGTYDDEAEREFNLGWSDTLPEHNKMVAGEWWSQNAPAYGLEGISSDAYPVSMEDEIAADFGATMGTRLEFLIGGRTLYGEVVNLREVDWGDFKPNFYILFPDGALDDFPGTFITSFHLPVAKDDFLLEVLRNFPSFGIISVERILGQLRDIMTLGVKCHAAGVAAEFAGGLRGFSCGLCRLA